jgi:cytochrome c55X
MLFVSRMVHADLSPSRQAELKEFTVQDCGSCHGLTFKGGLGPALLPESLAGKPKALLVSTILNGRPGTAMPPWKNLLTHDEASWITDQLLQGQFVQGVH